MDVQLIITNLVATLSDFGLKILGALAFWIIGRWLMRCAISKSAMHPTGSAIAISVYFQF